MAPLVCANARGCAGPLTTTFPDAATFKVADWQPAPSEPLGDGSAFPYLRSVLTTYHSADNCSGSTEGLVDSVSTGDLSYSYQGEWAR